MLGGSLNSGEVVEASELGSPLYLLAENNLPWSAPIGQKRTVEI
jgi:hypothetical protein